MQYLRVWAMSIVVWLISVGVCGAVPCTEPNIKISDILFLSNSTLQQALENNLCLIEGVDNDIDELRTLSVPATVPIIPALLQTGTRSVYLTERNQPTKGSDKVTLTATRRGMEPQMTLTVTLESGDITIPENTPANLIVDEGTTTPGRTEPGVDLTNLLYFGAPNPNPLPFTPPIPIAVFSCTSDDSPGGCVIVPEPSSLVLLASGLLGLLGFAWRKRPPVLFAGQQP